MRELVITLHEILEDLEEEIYNMENDDDPEQHEDLIGRKATHWNALTKAIRKISRG